MNREERNAYIREWRKANPERWAATYKRYYDTHREQIRTYQREYKRRQRAKKKEETEA